MVQESDKTPTQDRRAATDREATVLEELVARERAALDSYFAESDPSAYVALFAEHATYFDSNTGGRLDGDAYKQQFASYAGQIPPFKYEILNPAIDVRGNTAVFTFNVEMVDPADDTVAGVLHATEVHCRTDGGWEMIHAHWSDANPGS